MKTQSAIQRAQKMMALGMAGLLSASSCSAQTTPPATHAIPTTPTMAIANAGRPNVLLILADDLGWSDLSCYGGEIKTPNIDALAANGLKFTQCYNSARCSPSRASLLTGLAPHQAGFPNLSGTLSNHSVTLAEVLDTAGYSTSMVGKWHLNERNTPVDRGFQEYYGMLGGFNSYWQENPFYTRLPAEHSKHAYKPGEFYSTNAFADYSIDFITQAERTPNKPWFQYLAFNAPHFPLHAPEKDIEKYEPIYAQGWDKIRAGRLARQKQLGLVPKNLTLTPRSVVPKNWVNVQTGWADKDNPAWDSLPTDRRADLARRMAVYAAAVDKMDQSVGRVVTYLKKTNQYDNTLIFFLSDNGACAEWDPYGFDQNSGPKNILHTGDDLKKVGSPDSYVSYGSGWANTCNTPWRLYKHYAHEGGIRTPLIVHWPKGLKTKPGSMTTQPAMVADFMPTLVQICGGTYPTERNGLSIMPTQGASLLPIINGGKIAPRNLYMEHEGNRMVREGDWKLVDLEGKPWELYNVADDPTEMHDLAVADPKRVEKLSADWEIWAENSNVKPKVSQSQNPQLVGKALTITCKVTPQSPDGVILAQGGDQRGYALYISEGKPIFVVRQQGQLYTAAAPTAPTGPFSLEAHLQKDGAMTLAINGTIVANGKAPGVFTVQPKDELSIGEDVLSAVGDYKAPYPLKGKIEDAKVVAQ
ncbi:arylsulfatase [Abditibacteriota bacterium]|nr:arylsulfatase [Abditibacteriota bacterium]